MAIVITEAMTTLAEAEHRLHLSRTEDESFFAEWHRDLPSLSESESVGLSDLRRRYLYQRAQGHRLESTVLLLFASPLLTLAGFYDPLALTSPGNTTEYLGDDPPGQEFRA